MHRLVMMHRHLATRHGWLAHDLARTVMHAAVWRSMWALPLSVVLVLGALAALVLVRRT